MKNKLIVALIAFLAIANFAFGQSVSGTIKTESIRYTVDGQELIGYLAYDASSTSPRPGVLVVHEWLGINDYAKKRAEDLANEGYVAFALDMYGEGKEITTAQARTISGKVGSDFPLIKKRFNEALDILKQTRFVDPDKIAAIGYCFGGGIVLNMARMGIDIKGVVGFHSSLNTGLSAKAGDVKTKILAFQGDADPAAPEDRQKTFVKEMKEAGADFTYIVFGNLPAHNFTNPKGATYYEDEANIAWGSMLTFFDSIFK
jgi:dienelactone hydrolase